jgi:hypothetical protein
MPITSEQMKAAIGEAIYLDDVDNREAARQLVLAVTRLRVHLQADAELPDEIKAHDDLARSME